MKSKVIPMFDVYELECNTAVYIEISNKYGGLQKLSQDLQEAVASGCEGKALSIITDLLVSLINGAIKSHNYKAKKLSNGDLKELITADDIYYNYDMLTILNSSEKCMQVITDSLKFQMPDNVKTKPVDLTLKKIEEEEKKS